MMHAPRILAWFLWLAAGAAAAQAPALEEVPFVVSPDNVTLAMLKLANVGAEDYLIDLGSGDGRIVILAAKRFGARGLGVELSPQLVQQSRDAARAAGVESRAFFREQDLFKTDLAPATVVTMYLLPDVNLALRPKLLQLRPGTRIVSHDWDMGEWQPDRTIKVDVPDKPVGLEKASRIHLWIVPARLQGTWCGIGKAKGVRLELAQEFQRLRGELARGEERERIEGKIDGFTARAPRRFNLHLEGERLRFQPLDRKYNDLQRAVFTRARRGDCPVVK
jgi:SAM-dependent methyltransferase